MPSCIACQTCSGWQCGGSGVAAAAPHALQAYPATCTEAASTVTAPVAASPRQRHHPQTPTHSQPYRVVQRSAGLDQARVLLAAAPAAAAQDVRGRTVGVLAAAAGTGQRVDWACRVGRLLFSVRGGRRGSWLACWWLRGCTGVAGWTRRPRWTALARRWGCRSIR